MMTATIETTIARILFQLYFVTKSVVNFPARIAQRITVMLSQIPNAVNAIPPSFPLTPLSAMRAIKNTATPVMSNKITVTTDEMMERVFVGMSYLGPKNLSPLK